MSAIAIVNTTLILIFAGVVGVLTWEKGRMDRDLKERNKRRIELAKNFKVGDMVTTLDEFDSGWYGAVQIIVPKESLGIVRKISDGYITIELNTITIKIVPEYLQLLEKKSA